VNQRTYSLTEERIYLFKLLCYNLQVLQGVPERDHWKMAFADITYHFEQHSIAHQLLGNLFQNLAHEMLEGGSVWERKV
jgi:hypothetical protein